MKSIQLLAADIVSRVHRSEDSTLNLAQLVEGMICQHLRDGLIEERSQLRADNERLKDDISKVNDFREALRGNYRKPEEDIATLRAKIQEKDAVLKKLVEWDKAFPKGKVYPFGPNDPEKQLDAICELAQSSLEQKGEK